MRNQLIQVANRQPLLVYISVFADFVSILLERESSASQKSMHAGRWVTWPYERLLVDGSWMLLCVTANKYSKPVGTPDEIRKVASLCNRLFSIGLLLRYQSPVEAAAAFEKQVIGAINLAVGLGYRPGMIISNAAWRGLMRGDAQLASTELKGKKVPTVGSLSAFWGPPVYLFMFDCFKAARDLGEASRLQLAQYRAGNLLMSIKQEQVKHRGVKIKFGLHSCYLEDLNIDHEIDYLNPLSNIDWGDGYSPWLIKSILQLENRISVATLCLSTMRAIPMDFIDQHRSIFFMRNRLISNMWIDARIQEAIGAKAKEFVAWGLDRDYAKKIRRLGKGMITQKLIDLALSRGTRWDAQQLDCFRQLVAERLDLASPP